MRIYDGTPFEILSSLESLNIMLMKDKIIVFKYNELLIMFQDDNLL